MPDRTALLGRHADIFKYLMLELIHTYHVRNHFQRAHQVRITVIICFLSKECIHPGVCEMLHCHRVNLRHLACREYHIHKRNLFCRRIRLECMARLMSQNINVRARTIKVGEDERRLERIQKCAVTACLFSRLRLQVKQLMLHHKVKELTRLFRQLMVHLLRLRNQFLRRSFRNRVSFRENQLLIVIMQPVHSKPFLLLLPKLQAERYNLLLHLRTEPCNILRRIIVSSIAQVNKFNVRRKSQLLRNFIAQRNQLVIQRIQLPGNLFIQISPCRHRLFPHLAVRTLHRLQKSIKITRFALKFRRSIRRNFTVLLRQIRLFDQILHDTVVR